MNIYSYLIIGSYILLTAIFMFKFYKNDYDLKKTFKNFFKCCIKNREKVVEAIGEEKTEELEKNLKNCTTPIGFPFDICLNENYTREELILREKIFNILQQRSLKKLDGGIEKLVIPLQATLFLTKGLNPLVNENGEIQIVSKHKKISERLDEIIILLKNKASGVDELIYQDEEELLKSIVKLLEEMERNSLLSKTDFNKQEIVVKAKEALEIAKEGKESKEEIMVPEQQYFPPDDLIIKSVKIEPEQHSVFSEPVSPYKAPAMDSKFLEEETLSSSPFDDIKEESNVYDSGTFGGFGSNMFDELDELDLDEEPESVEMKNVPNFYKKELEWRIQKDIEMFDFENISHSMTRILSTDSILSSIFRNLSKTTPIIFSENKEYLYVDQLNILFAISKLYGLEFKKVADTFSRFKGKNLSTISDALAIIFEPYISDLVFNNKNANKVIIEDKNGNKYFSYGLFIQTRAFNKGLNMEQFDFFRSFPYNTEYKISLSQSSDSKNLSKLVSDIYDVEIK